MWANIDATMMSDEEDCLGRFQVRRPMWRSAAFDKLMDTLDGRAGKTSHPRIERFYGTPVRCEPPPNAKEWMIDNE